MLLLWGWKHVCVQSIYGRIVLCMHSSISPLLYVYVYVSMRHYLADGVSWGPCPCLPAHGLLFWCCQQEIKQPPPPLTSISLARASWVISSFVSLVLLVQVIFIIILYMSVLVWFSLLIFVFLHCSHSAANWTIPIAVCTISTLLHIIYSFCNSFAVHCIVERWPCKDQSCYDYKYVLSYLFTLFSVFSSPSFYHLRFTSPFPSLLSSLSLAVIFFHHLAHLLSIISSIKYNLSFLYYLILPWFPLSNIF